MTPLYLRKVLTYMLPGPARVLAKANDGSHVAIGGRDGRILVFDAVDPGPRGPVTTWTERSTAISALAHCSDGDDELRTAWLVGRANGVVEKVQLDRRDWARCPLVSPFVTDDDDRLGYVTAIAPLNRREIFVSFSVADARVYDVSGKWFHTKLGGQRVRTVAPLGGGAPGHHLLVTHTAELAAFDGTTITPLAVPSWESSRNLPLDRHDGPPSLVSFGTVRPTIVFDTALLPPERRHDSNHAELLLSTDAGLFLVRYEAGQTEVHPIPIRRFGMKGSSMGIAACDRWIWAADSLGRNHLYASVPVRGAREGIAEWPLAATCVLQSPAEQAVAICRLDGTLHVWHLCRDQTVAVVTLGATPIRRQIGEGGQENVTPEKPLGKLATIDEARTWLAANHDDALYKNTAMEPEAIIADLFDPSSAQEYPARDTARALWAFLADPSAALGAAVIRGFGDDTTRIRESLRLWTTTLIGSIHRLTRGERTERALSVEERAFGVLQWLDDLRRSLSTSTHASFIAQCIREETFAVKRWTVGAPLAEAEQLCLAAYLRRIATADEASQCNDDLSLDEEHLVKESLLFDRSVDLESQIPSQSPRAPDGAGVAFDIAETEIGERRRLVAVLWRHWRVGFYEIEDDPLDPKMRQLGDGLLLHDETAPTNDERRFGRGVELWRTDFGIGEQTLLLTSLKSTDETHGVEHLQLSRIDIEEMNGVRRARITPIATAGLRESDTITCLHRFRGSEFLAGLRRADGNATILWIKVDLDPRVDLPSIQYRELQYVANVERSLERVANPVQCIATTLINDRRVVVAGCGRGQVLCFELPAGPWRLEQLEPLPKTAEIDRLAVPVWSVAVQGDSDGHLRVFAGGGDGRIIAWQRLPVRTASGTPPSVGRDTPPAATPRYAKVWATREKAPIVRLDVFDAVLGDTTHHRRRQPIVVAISHDGRATVFANQRRIGWGSYDHPEDSRRPRIPGQRLARFKLRRSTFAALLLPVPVMDVAIERFVPMCRFLVVDGNAAVSLLALHFPKRSFVRREAYKRIWSRWSSLLRPAGRFEPRRMRLIEALRLLAPNLWLLPVPFLVPASTEHLEREPDDGCDIYWYPRYFRPFVRAARAYRQILRKLPNPELTSTRLVDVLEKGVEQALHEAFRLRDAFLFKEITETILKRFGGFIKAVCSRPTADADELLGHIYDRLLRTVENACRLWLGPSPGDYALVQIVSLKNVVDGDVLLHLTIPDHAEVETKPLQSMIHKRTQYAQRLLMAPHPLVPLETLRATNLSLTRAAWIMRQENKPQSPDIDDFLRVLGAFASQAVDRSDDVLGTEIARSYGIALFVSPQRAAQQTLAIRESRMPERIVEETKRQTELFHELFADPRAPSTVGEAEPMQTKLMDHLLAHDGDTRRNHYLLVPSDWRAAGTATAESAAVTELAAYFGDFAGLIELFDPLNRLLETLHRLAFKLRNSPELADLRAAVECITDVTVPAETKADAADAREGRVETPSEPSRFLEDVTFWTEALTQLRQICDDYGIDVPPAYPQTDEASDVRDDEESSEQPLVKPALVLASSALAKWAHEWGNEVQERRIPEPFAAMYRFALRELGVAADGLSNSASVQRRLVTGILGHHLMEALDEHVIDMDQIAHVTMPKLLVVDDAPPKSHGAADGTVNDGQQESEPPMHHDAIDMPQQGGAAAQFAALLRAHAERAQSIPKNLRTLYQLLEGDKDEPTSRPEGDGISLGELIEEAFEDLDFPERFAAAYVDVAKGKTTTHLRLALRELASNHLQHGSRIYLPHFQPEEHGVSILMYFAHDDEKRHQERLDRLRRKRLQAVAPPYGRTSNGLGLYLANLAAAMVGWTLQIKDLGKVFVEFSLRKDAAADVPVTPGEPE